MTSSTVNWHLDTMVDALFARWLTPKFENLKRRQVKAPKVYLSDGGLLHALLHVRMEPAVLGHPTSGASWEGFAMHETMRILSAN